MCSFITSYLSWPTGADTSTVSDRAARCVNSAYASVTIIPLHPKRSLCSAASQIPFEDLEIAEQIGGGGFSLVYKGFWKGTPVAVKKWFDPNMTDALIQEFRRVCDKICMYVLCLSLPLSPS